MSLVESDDGFMSVGLLGVLGPSLLGNAAYLERDRPINGCSQASRGGRNRLLSGSGKMTGMRLMRRWIVDGLELGCRATRLVGWVPGWNHVYHCQLAKWSNQLDARWDTGRWPVHAASGPEGWEEWEAWWNSLTDEQRFGKPMHVWD
jgi:hypothetical protein